MSSELFKELGTGFEASWLRQPLLEMIRIKSQGPSTIRLVRGSGRRRWPSPNPVRARCGSVHAQRDELKALAPRECARLSGELQSEVHG